MKERTERIFGLDLIRAIAILIVVMAHGDFMIDKTILSGFPYINTIDGVDLFFVLSGFLIGNILLKEINKSREFGLHELSIFWKRRWFRTLPNYYLILILNYIFVSNKFIIEGIENFNWKFFFFLHNFSTPFAGFFWESWSLSVEEWFYILLPLLLLLLLKFSNPKTAFLITALIMLIFPVIYRISIYDPNIDSFWYDVARRKLVITRLDSVAYGLIAAWIYYYNNTFWNKSRFITFIVGIALMFFMKNVIKLPHTTFYRQVVYFSLSPFSAMLILPLAESIKNGYGILAKGITHISKISYSMYLLNLAIVAEVLRDNFGPFEGIQGIYKYGIYWTIVIIASSLLYKYFEMPMMNLRDKTQYIKSILPKNFRFRKTNNIQERQHD